MVYLSHFIKFHHHLLQLFAQFIHICNHFTIVKDLYVLTFLDLFQHLYFTIPLSISLYPQMTILFKPDDLFYFDAAYANFKLILFEI